MCRQPSPLSCLHFVNTTLDPRTHTVTCRIVLPSLKGQSWTVSFLFCHTPTITPAPQDPNRGFSSMACYVVL